MEKKSFIMHAEWLSMFSALPDADAGAIIKAMIRYTCSGDAGAVEPVHAGILAMLIDGYEADKARYIETCERNRANVLKRWGKDNTTVYDRIQPYTTEYETIPLNTDMDMEKDMDSEKDTEKDKGKQKKGANAPKKDSERIAETMAVFNAWNGYTIRGRIPKINDITGRRASAIGARLKEHGVDKVLEAIGIVFASEFLRGDNSGRWNATFDWFVKPDNFRKVIEGNYANKRSNATQADIIRGWMEGTG